MTARRRIDNMVTIRTEREVKEENARLRAALKSLQEAAAPFADHDWYDAELEDDSCKLTKHSGPVTVGHWRRLGRALNETRDTPRVMAKDT